MLFSLVKIFVPTAVAFFSGMLITPLATHFFFKYQMWKKTARTENTSSLEFKSVHETKALQEVSVPCVGGVIVLFSVIITTLIFAVLPYFFKSAIFDELNFLSREQTLVPLFIFIFGAFLGLVDDVLEIHGRSHITRNSPWYTKLKISMVVLCGLLAGWWFFSKLGMNTIHIPFDGYVYLGWLFIPAVVLVMFGTFSGGVIDGIDGLAGGVMTTIFAAYAVVAYIGNYLDIAALCGVVAGAVLAFLWFNIPPARFYMGEVGMMPLTITLAAVAFLTDTVLLLPIIAFPLVLTSLSSAIQIISKKFFGKKVFKVAPIHHHFEALGWPSYKVTMRFWVLSVIFSIIGIILKVVS